MEQSTFSAIAASFAAIIAMFNYIKLRSSILDITVEARRIVSNGKFLGLDWGSTNINYKNISTNDINSLSIFGKILFDNDEIDISPLLPKKICLPPNQGGEITLDTAHIVEGKGHIFNGENMKNGMIIEICACCSSFTIFKKCCKYSYKIDLNQPHLNWKLVPSTEKPCKVSWA
jgi:hypothetical protein